jgi:tRNA (guanine37-N1)-methyltransferase
MKEPLHFHFLSLFPEAIQVWLTSSILGRAHKVGLFRFDLYQLRDYAQDKHHSVDDTSYGGGGGMVLRCEPLVSAVESIRAQISPERSIVIYPTPAGIPLKQDLLDKLGSDDGPRHLIFVCGHYEGVDQRFLDHWVDLEISLGDFVLTGGELPAVAVADALIRQMEGTLGEPEGAKTESFRLQAPDSGRPLLEYPQYTRPSNFRGHTVPEILLSGNHEKVRRWRIESALAKTRKVRPDL